VSQSLSEAAAARLDAFHALLDDDPQDWLIRSHLADWYADQGDSVAEDCLRWQAQEKKRPLSIGQRWIGQRWNWYDLATYEGRHDYLEVDDPESDLPQPLFRCLKELRYRVTADGPTGEPYTLVRYPSRRAAEEDLLAAWRTALESGAWTPEAP
jgi:hypothetical protein